MTILKTFAPSSESKASFAELCPFFNPLIAAGIMLGRNSNERIERKVKIVKQTYNDWQQVRAEIVEVYDE